MNWVRTFPTKLGYMWYLMNPYDHLFENVDSVPDYYKEVTPAFIFVIILEQCIRLLQGRKIMRLNDSVANICQGMLVELFKIPLYGIELIVYTWIYNNWRFCTLPWDSIWTWILCLICTDFGFYWMHRATHQISILWLFHEPHHSSEDYNMTTPLRLSIFTSSTLWLTYLPMAFAVPPSTFLVHYQLNVIFQYWLHTDLVKTLGIIEYVFVTPSHHRVHHGRNRRCIDKNFGSVFILWDRMFGTFELEKDEKIIYGVTQPLKTFNPIHIQTNHLQTIWKKFNTVDGFKNKLFAIIKGPGWSPGKPWLGTIEDIPEPKDEDLIYDPRIPRWLELYIILHMAALVIGYLQLILSLKILSTFLITASGLYIIFTTVAIGCLLDLSIWGPVLELLRCVLYFMVDALVRKELSSLSVLLNISLHSFRILSLFSLMFWIFASPFTVFISQKQHG
ncbi:alkylglycerol monooxygenase-like [Uloborus diversus]|uniref:alkylglycerol monooxygenase-like n=1 Tax=Uloborus diversus TaxID=327109 RepID=UPI002409A231|nr:alkylglycerol monooxygenase-like [Uloborus diversus]